MPCVNFDKILPIILSICCYGVSIYMVAVLFSKYGDNLDASRASMKQFNGAPQGRYPSFTFCMYAEEGRLFRDDILQNKFKLSQMILGLWKLKKNLQKYLMWRLKKMRLKVFYQIH